MRDYQAVTTEEGLKILVKELMDGPEFVGFDVETGYTSAEASAKRALDTRHPDFIVVGFSITNSPQWARYIPLRHDNEQPLDPKMVWELFRPVFETKQIVAHNASFERAALNSLHRTGDVEKPLQLKQLGHDTMLLISSLWAYRQFGLKQSTKDILGVEQVEFSTLFGDTVKDKNGKVSAAKLKRARFNHLPISPEVISYGCDDSALCLELLETLLPTMTEAQRRSYMVEMQIMVLMSHAEEYGVGVDWSGMKTALAQYENFRPLFENKVREEFAAMTVDPAVKELARTANFGSAVQMRKLLYDGLNMSTTRTTKAGSLSTDAQALEALSRKHSAVRSLLSLREIDNLGRRLKKWLTEYSTAYDKRVHPSFSQTRVITGRFAASDPAIQQLGKDWFWSLSDEVDEEGNPVGVNGEDFWCGNFRKFIIAGEGNKLLTFDYQAQEVRVLAGITQEPALVSGFAKKQDPHKVAASIVFGVPYEHVSSAQRTAAKTVQFGILYGMGSKTLAERLAMEPGEAQDIIDTYKSRLSRVGMWDQQSRIRGIVDNKITTWFGRDVPLWNSYSEDNYIRSGAERLAVNAQIQGGAADYTKLAMLRSWSALKSNDLWGDDKVMLTMNQHDSLTFEFNESIDPNKLREILQEAVVFEARKMFPKLNVPHFPVFEVDWEMGKTWGGSVKWPLEVDAVLVDNHWQVEGSVEDVGQIVGWEPSSEEDSIPTVSNVSFGPSTIHVVMKNPTSKGVQAFRKLVLDKPGDNTLYLTAGDKTAKVKETSSLSLSDFDLISLVVGGAEVFQREENEMKEFIDEG